MLYFPQIVMGFGPSYTIRLLTNSSNEEIRSGLPPSSMFRIFPEVKFGYFGTGKSSGAVIIWIASSITDWELIIDWYNCAA
jgi:hypothetical protein